MEAKRIYFGSLYERKKKKTRTRNICRVCPCFYLNGLVRDLDIYVCSMYCLGCGTDLTNQQANRRVVSSHSDIVDLWKTVVSEWDDQYTSAEDIVQEQPYMCRGCFSAYSRFIAMKTKITTNIAEAMRCFSIVSSKKQRLESPYAASELSL